MGLQRFKEMREMHGSSSRDDRNKREQQREEREMAKFAQMYLSFFLLHLSFSKMIFCDSHFQFFFIFSFRVVVFIYYFLLK